MERPRCEVLGINRQSMLGSDRMRHDGNRVAVMAKRGVACNGGALNGRAGLCMAVPEGPEPEMFGWNGWAVAEYIGDEGTGIEALGSPGADRL